MNLHQTGSMVNWYYRGLQGVKNTLSVAPVSILFSAVSSPKNKSRNDLQSIPYRVNINNQ